MAVLVGHVFCYDASTGVTRELKFGKQTPTDIRKLSFAKSPRVCWTRLTKRIRHSPCLISSPWLPQRAINTQETNKKGMSNQTQWSIIAKTHHLPAARRPQDLIGPLRNHRLGPGVPAGERARKARGKGHGPAKEKQTQNKTPRKKGQSGLRGLSSPGCNA